MKRPSPTRKAFVLSSLIQSQKLSSGVIVGDRDGRMSAYLLAQRPGLSLALAGAWSKEEQAHVHGALSHFPGRAVTLNGAPTTAAKAFPPESVEFVFLACQPAELAPLVRAWGGAIAADGVMLGHDWTECGAQLDAIFDDRWQRYSAGVWMAGA